MKANRTKNYIIITQSLSKIGGAQTYSMRRSNYLKKKGYNVIVITRPITDFVLKNEFSGIKVFETSIIDIEFDVLSENHKVNFLTQILSRFKDQENNLTDYCVESHTANLSLFGEYVAYKFGGKHLTYFLFESKLSYAEGGEINAFFKRKLALGELIGITKLSLPMIFNSKLVNDNNRFVNISINENEVVEYDEWNFSDNERFNLSIGIISRLEKRYVSETIDSLIKLALNYPNKKLNLSIIGDSKDKNITIGIKNIIAEAPANLRISFLGRFSPIPKQFFYNLDFTIGMGTSAVISISQNCPALIIDPFTNQTHGFLGIDVFNFGYNDNNSFRSLSIFLKIESLLLNGFEKKKKSDKGFSFFKANYSFLKNMEEMDNFFETSKRISRFSLIEKKPTMKKRVRRYLLLSVGAGKYLKISKYLLNFRKRQINPGF